LLGAGAYIAAINNWPVLSPILYWVALQTYEIAGGRSLASSTDVITGLLALDPFVTKDLSAFG